jgi:glutamine synthetase
MVNAMTNFLDLDTLKGADFDTVIIAAPDMQGRLFGKRMPTRLFEQAIEHGIHVSSCTLGWDIVQALGLVVDYTGFHTGWHDFRLVPDLRTLRPAPWLEGTAIVIADIVEDATGELVPLAPRTILRRQIETLKRRGYTAYVGTELEFYLYECSYEQARASGYRTLPPTTPLRSDYAIQHRTNRFEPFFRTLRRSLDQAGIDVYLSQAEWGYGQWEINLVFQEALEMADRHVLFKLAVKDLAAAAGMAATFMPRPSPEEIGSSCHVHVSLRDPQDASVFFDGDAPHKMSPLMQQAIGGVLAHAPELMLWYAPTINSYHRTTSNDVAGRGNTWGFDNRTVSCRVLGQSPAALRMEYRVPGADVNPYLGIAGLLAAIDDGIAQQTSPSDPVLGDAYQQSIVGLPDNLASATALFAASPFTSAVFGEQVVRHYTAVAQFEWAQFMAAVTDWEKERYFELI